MGKRFFHVYPPDDRHIEAWLAQYDSRPRLIPVWPESDKLTIVVVTATMKGPGRALVAVRKADWTRIFMSRTTSDKVRRHVRRLYFTVPRSILIREDVCPGLTPEHFVA